MTVEECNELIAKIDETIEVYNQCLKNNEILKEKFKNLREDIEKEMEESKNNKRKK